jgi:peptidoglycan/xylan/chitin deacetylase (PgdA/CDA1 family)
MKPTFSVNSPALFLTFDDGPDPRSTPALLDLLKSHRVLGTFFVIVEKAKENPDILWRLRDEGHSVGNHSLDHRFRHLFFGKTHLKKWIRDAEAELEILLQQKKSVGFRPPAGVLPPPLKRALHESQLPTILWNLRFYDRVFPLTKSKIQRKLPQITGGSILLLHDAQKPKFLSGFLEAIDYLICEAKERQWAFRPLTSEVIL